MADINRGQENLLKWIVHTTPFQPGEYNSMDEHLEISSRTSQKGHIHVPHDIKLFTENKNTTDLWLGKYSGFYIF